MKKRLTVFLFLIATLLVTACHKPDDEKKKDVPVVTATEIKLVAYNVLYGMEYDIKNNWDNFVKWVKEQDPDILCLEEALFDRAEFADLAKRFGHEYYYLCDIRPTTSVGITSKYPIELIDDQLCSDGYIRAAFWVKVVGLNIIPLHLYYKSTVEGDAIRVKEMNSILSKTIKKHTECDNWVMCGDFNDQAKEDGRWSTLNPSRKYELHDNIKKAGYKDCVRLMNPDDWCRTMQTVAHEGSGGTYRLDYIYATQNVADCLVEAGRIKDNFTDYASDHYPIYAIFDLTKLKN